MRRFNRYRNSNAAVADGKPPVYTVEREGRNIHQLAERFQTVSQTPHQRQFISGMGGSLSGSNCHRVLWAGANDQVKAVLGKKHDMGHFEFHDSTSWYGRRVRGWSDVEKMAMGKWDDGLTIIRELQESLKSVKLPVPTNIRRRTQWSEEGGDELDLDRLKSRQPYWRTTSRQRSTGPRVITLAVQVNASAMFEAKQVMWRGVLAMTLSQILEAAGYRAEILAYDNSIGVFRSGDDFLQGMWIKRAQDRLDEVQMVNTISPWWFRTVIFGSYGLVPGQQAESPLGYPVITRDEEIEWLVGHPNFWRVDGVWNREDTIQLGVNLIKKLS